MDFGKTTQVTSVSGVIKFKNTGDSVLNVEDPKPTCGCTIAKLSSNTLQPGEAAELPFTLQLGTEKAKLAKHIVVKSNDPLTSNVSLEIKADYTPLYELNPMTLSPNLVFGMSETNQIVTLTRNDGKLLRVDRMEATKPWITATLEPSDKANQSIARILVAVKREGTPRRFNEYVHIYTDEETNVPAANISVYGHIAGEVSLSLEALYWSISGVASAPQQNQEAQTVRKITIRSASGKAFEIKNAKSTIKGINVEVAAKEAGQVYELIARLDEIPSATISGNVTFDTSVADQSTIEIPVIVNVFKP
jgi:hypothetical protein